VLEEFISFLSKKRINVFEFRHKSWFSDDTFELLDRNGAGFCVHNLSGLETPKVATGDLIYVRFHGPAGKYAGNYSLSSLQKWVEWIKPQGKKVKSVFAYFNNDYNAYAVFNAKQLRKAAG